MTALNSFGETEFQNLRRSSSMWNLPRYVVKTRPICICSCNQLPWQGRCNSTWGISHTHHTDQPFRHLVVFDAGLNGGSDIAALSASVSFFKAMVWLNQWLASEPPGGPVTAGPPPRLKFHRDQRTCLSNKECQAAAAGIMLGESFSFSSSKSPWSLSRTAFPTLTNGFNTLHYLHWKHTKAWQNVMGNADIICWMQARASHFLSFIVSHFINVLGCPC